ncbi:hypothetical protein CONCODRAFT_167916, partial [Conidiobolus coronatus NRRL 28638]
KLSSRKLKKLICAQIIEDLANKSKLVKKVVLTSRINPKLANLFFEKFNYCTTIIIDSEDDLKLSAVYNILKHLNYLEVFYMELIYESDPNSTLHPPNFKFPKTLKSITTFPCILENNFIPAINEISFNTYPNIIKWSITGRYDAERFLQQQSNIIHLYLHDVPTISFNNFKSILVNNPQLKTLVYELGTWSIEKLNVILALPNLKKLVISYSFDIFNVISLKLIANTTIKTLLLIGIIPSMNIEELLTRLHSLKDIIFIRWNLYEISAVNWVKFRGKLNSVTFGHSFYTEKDLGNVVDCLRPKTKITFNKVKDIINFDLSI